MSSIGQTLRDERVKQQLSLSEIATSTCISSMYLQAIEVDNVGALPGYFFYKNFVKQYAAALGVDYKTLEEGVARLAPPAEEDVLPVLSANYQVPKRVQTTNILTRHPLMWSGLSFMAVMVVCSGVYSWWHNAQVSRMEARLAAPVRAPAGPVQVSAPVQTPAPDVALAAEPPAPQPEAQPAKNSVDIAATEKTWVSLKSEGKTIFRGMLAPSETRQIEIAERASLTTGNAAALEVRLNGKPLGPLGGRGEVRTILFLQGSAQILNASQSSSGHL